MQMGYMCRETDESTVLVEVTMLDNQFIITNVSACFHDTVIDFKIPSYCDNHRNQYNRSLAAMVTGNIVIITVNITNIKYIQMNGP